MKLKVSVRIVGLDRFPDRAAVSGAIERALRAVQARIIVRARRNLSGRFLRTRTGKLRRGFQTSFRRTGGSWVATVRNRVFYGQILEKGAEPHLVPLVVRGPRTGRRRPKVLKFEAGGRTIFARQVTHPGLRPRPWWQDAVADVAPDLQELLAAELAGIGAPVTASRVRVPGRL